MYSCGIKTVSPPINMKADNLNGVLHKYYRKKMAIEKHMLKDPIIPHPSPSSTPHFL
jgi:hypothetical protein